MQHSRSLDELQLKNSWVTIGSFDGVHLGHQALIGAMTAEAHSQDGQSVVVTFFPHPVKVLRGLEGAFYLTTPDERARLLGALGVDHVITLPFDRRLANKSAEEFMTALSAHLGLRCLWVGSDFALGRGREGNTQRLAELGEQLGYTVRLVDITTEGDEVISSSRIRALLQQGHVSEAARLLGRYYRLDAPVVHGDGRGKDLGIPTANLDVWSDQVIPANGIYATRAWVGGERIDSVSNVGTRPTFEQANVPPRVEAHLLRYDGDLYGQTVGLEFVEYLRPEMLYDTIQALLDQIRIDILQAEEVLHHAR